MCLSPPDNVLDDFLEYLYYFFPKKKIDVSDNERAVLYHKFMFLFGLTTAAVVGSAFCHGNS